jgi:hypothetical protein
MKHVERTGRYFVWLLDANGNKVGEPTTIRTVCGAQGAIVLFRRRTGRKAANTRLNIDIRVDIEEREIAPERVEQCGNAPGVYRIHPDGSWRDKR